MFKVGDKVRRTSTVHPRCKAGNIYTVKAVYRDGVTVALEEVADERFESIFFELVKEAPKPAVCKFKPGNKYKTRDGLEAIVYAVYPDTNQAFPVHGAYKDPDGHYISTCWTSEGRSIAYETLDLQPNKRKVYINLRKTSSNMILVGHDRPYDTAEEAELGAAMGVSAGNNYVAIAVPIEFEE